MKSKLIMMACMVRLRVSENSIETETILVDIRNCVPTIVDHF